MIYFDNRQREESKRRFAFGERTDCKNVTVHDIFDNEYL